MVARNWDELTNGAQGLGGIHTPKLFGFDFGFSPYPYYFLGLGLVAVAVWISIRLQESRVGRAWMAIREDELAAGAMGVNHVHYKLLAFAMGAAVGGLAGTFYVAKLTTATPDMFTFPVSVMVLVMVVLGGLDPRRGPGRALRGVSPVRDPPGPHRVRARARAPGGEPVPPARGADHLARADLRAHPGPDDDLPAGRAVAGRAAGVGPHPRAAGGGAGARIGGPAVVGAAGAGRRARTHAPPDRGPDQALRGGVRRRRHHPRRAGRRAGERHRAEWIREDHALQPDHRAHAAGRREHPPGGTDDRGVAVPRDRRARGGAHLPEHPPLQQSERAREPPRRRARAPRASGSPACAPRSAGPW